MPEPVFSAVLLGNRTRAKLTATQQPPQALSLGAANLARRARVAVGIETLVDERHGDIGIGILNGIDLLFRGTQSQAPVPPQNVPETDSFILDIAPHDREMD